MLVSPTQIWLISLLLNSNIFSHEVVQGHHLSRGAGDSDLCMTSYMKTKSAVTLLQKCSRALTYFMTHVFVTAAVYISNFPVTHMFSMKKCILDRYDKIWFIYFSSTRRSLITASCCRPSSCLPPLWSLLDQVFEWPMTVSHLIVINSVTIGTIFLT